MDEQDKIQVLLYGINGTKGIIARLESVENNTKDLEKIIEDHIVKGKELIANLEKQHVSGWNDYTNKHCGVDCKGAMRMQTHELQHKQLVDITQSLMSNQLEERKSRRTIIVAIITAAVPSLITLIKELLK